MYYLIELVFTPTKTSFSRFLMMKLLFDQVYGIVRHRGADMEWHKCELDKRELYEDHVCTTLDDLEPMNCKRSKWELNDPGAVEDCR